MSLQTEARRLIAEITEAFAEVPHPGPKNITNEGCCEECDEIAAWYGWHTAEELLRELEIHENESPSMLLKPSAFHYFLPAYLIHSLEPFDPEADRLSSCVYALCSIFETTQDKYIANIHSEEMRLFNSRQRNAIVSYLRFLARVFEMTECETLEFWMDRLRKGIEHWSNSASNSIMKDL
jgi:hypothetical protein